MNETATFGEWLKHRRKALDLTQEQLADRVSCSHETIRKIEVGARRPSREMVEAIAHCLAVPLEQRFSLVQFARSSSTTTVADLPFAYPRNTNPQGPSTNLPRLGGHWAEGRRYLTTLLRKSRDEVRPLRARAFFQAGRLAMMQDDYMGARALFEQSLSEWRETGNQSGIAQALSGFGVIARSERHYDLANELFEGSLSIRRELNDKPGVVSCLRNLGIVAWQQGLYEKSSTLLNQSLVMAREIGLDEEVVYLLLQIGLLEVSRDNVTTGKALLEESQALSRQLGDKYALAAALQRLGHVLLQQGEIAEAKALLTDGITLAATLGTRAGVAYYVTPLAKVANSKRAPKQAARLLGAADALLEGIGTWVEAPDESQYEMAIAAARSHLGALEFERLWAEGRVISMKQAIEYALSENRDE